MLKRSLALGALMAFVITGQAWAEVYPDGLNVYSKTGDLTVDSVNVTGPDGTTGIYTANSHKLVVSGNTTINVSSQGNLSGLYSILASTAEFGKAGSDAVADIDVVTSPGNVKYATNGLFVTGDKTTVTFNGSKLDVYVDGGVAPDTNGIYTGNYGKLILNSAENIITVKGDDANGITALSWSEVTVNGDLNLTSNDGDGTAIAVRGDSITKINETGENTVNIKGDIRFTYDEKTSGSKIDADVIINLNGSNSSFEGSIYKDLNGLDPADEKANVNGMNLTLSNGAKWNVTGDSFVNDLSGQGGKLVNAAESDVTVNIHKPGNVTAMTGTAVNVGEGVTLDISSDDTSGNGIVKDVNITGEGNLNITSDKAQFAIGYGQSTIDVDQLKIELTNKEVYGVVSSDNNTTGDHEIRANDAYFFSGNDVFNMQGEHDIIVDVANELNVVSENGYVINNLSKENAKIDLTGNTINLTSNDRTAVKVGNEVGDKGYNGIVNIGDANTETITIKSAAQKPADKNVRKSSAVHAQAGAINLSATDTITIEDTAKVGGNAIGAYGGVVNVEDAAKVVIDGKVYATGEGSQVNITTTGDVDVNDAGIDMSSTEEDALAIATNKGAITITGNKENIITLTGGGGEWDNGRSQAIAASYGGTSTVKDFKEVIFAGEHAHSGFYAFAGGTTVVENIGTIKQTKDSSIGQAFNAFGGNLTVKADVIDIDNTGNGIFAQTAGANDGIINVEAKTIDIKGANDLIAGRKMNAGTGTTSVTVKADDIILVADKDRAAINCNNNYNQVNYNDDNITTVIANNKLSITGSNAVNANHGLKMVL